MRHTSFPAVRATAFLIAMAATSAFAQSLPALPANQINAKLQAQLAVVMREKASRTPAMQKMDQGLIFAVRQLHGYNYKKDLPKLEIQNVIKNDGTVDIELVGSVTESLVAQIQNLGGDVTSAYPRYNSLSATLPATRLESVAMLPGVKSIRTPDKYYRNSGSVQSQGDVSVRADLARSYYGLSGSGYTVGVISDSNDHQETSQASFDLPASINVLSGRSGRTGSGEGTAMMEIVYDLAPGSGLAFSTANGGQSAFAQNYRDLFAAGCNVLCDDVFYFAEPAFQDGPIAKAINDISKSGAIVFSAAGNEGNQRFKDNPNLDYSAVWEGNYASSGTTITGGGHTGTVHTFGTSVRNKIQDVGTGYLTLQWNDPWTNASSDYDLYIVDASNNVITYSAGSNVGGTPYEQAFTSSANNRYALVTKFSGNDRVIRVNQIRGWMQFTTPGQIWGHAASEYALGTGTINQAGRAFNSADGPTYYSSDGPRRVFYDDNGAQIATDLTLAGAVVRQQPVITAVDGVSTTLPSNSGLNPFYGTSAAAPHAAAVAALLREFAPDATPTDIRNALTQGAIDLLTAGWDPFSGAGAVNSIGALKVLMEAKTQGVTPTTGTVTGTTPATLTLNLGRNAPPAGLTVDITATGDTGVFTVPASVVVLTGTQTASFSVGANGSGTGTVNLTLKEHYSGAQLGTATVNRTVGGPTVSSVSVDPTEVVGASRNVSGKVTLSAPATSTFTVELQSSNPAVATVPATVSISTNGTFKTFVVTSYPVATDTPVTIRARKAGSSDAYTETTLTVKAPKPNSCVPNPTSGLPGTSVTFTVKLDGPAPTGGIAVGLVTTDATVIAVPRTLTVPAGATSASFTTTAGPSQTKKTVTVSVRYQSATVAQGKFTVTVPEVSALTLTPSSVKGGVNSKGTVTLASAAPTGGTLVTLSKTGTGATIPTTVVVPAGSTSVNFTITTSTVTKNTNFKIVAKTAAVTKTVTLVITP